MIIKNILNILKKVDSINTTDFFGHYSSKYVWKQIFEREARERGWKPFKEIIEERRKKELKKFYRTLSFLKKQGFIQKIGSDGKSRIWKLTKRGLAKLLELDIAQDGKLLPMKFDSFEKGDLKVLVFDIPEKLKRHRNWLRQTLVNLGFAKLQKSVWIGDNKFPEEFIYNLRKLGIGNHVHIFSVKSQGTVASSN